MNIKYSNLHVSDQLGSKLSYIAGSTIYIASNESHEEYYGNLHDVMASRHASCDELRQDG